MALRDPGGAFLAEAFELLQEADRMHRQFFTVALGRSGPSWEPPVDVVESERSLAILVALPGVRPDAVEIVVDGSSLRVVGVRRIPAGPGDRIHRLEIPHGRFERRIALPPGRFELTARDLVDGCLVIQLDRIA